VAPKAPNAIAVAIVVAIPIAASIVHCLLPRTNGDACVLSTRLNKYQCQDRLNCKDKLFEKKHVAPKAPMAIGNAIVIAIPIAASIVHCLLPRTKGDA